MSDDWRDPAIEAFAAAWYQAVGCRKNQMNPRFELIDPVIAAAFRKAARRYVDGGPLVEPMLHMEPRYTPEGLRLHDEWVEGHRKGCARYYRPDDDTAPCECAEIDAERGDQA